jgi:hypothetical protein
MVPARIRSGSTNAERRVGPRNFIPSLSQVGSRAGAPIRPAYSAVPRFQPPLRRTQHPDFPHSAPPFASCQGLRDLSCRGDFRHVASHPIAAINSFRVSYSHGLLHRFQPKGIVTLANFTCQWRDALMGRIQRINGLQSSRVALDTSRIRYSWPT